VRHGENGLLVPASDPVALADAIQLLAQDFALLQHLAAGARTASAGDMSWEVFASRCVDAIEDTRRVSRGPAEAADTGL
jgi:glycosyltransferase involved in cell wall biosynthesis